MAKELKKWNGRGHGSQYGRGSLYVAAYTQKQAIELLNTACDSFITVNEIRKYYSQCWGNPMEGIDPTEPGVWWRERYGKPVIKIL